MAQVCIVGQDEIEHHPRYFSVTHWDGQGPLVTTFNLLNQPGEMLRLADSLMHQAQDLFIQVYKQTGFMPCYGIASQLEGSISQCHQIRETE